MNVRLTMVVLALSALMLEAVGQTPGLAKSIPGRGKAVALFDGKHPDDHDTFLEHRGDNTDPEGVFRIEKGVLHVSGTEMGYMITRQSFGDFYLRVEFKWGDGTFGVRKGKARDSGILYHVQGENRLWPQSIEFQITEGGTGDFWLTDTAAITGKDGQRVESPVRRAVKIDHIGKGPVKDVVGYRDPVGDMERPWGEWNVLELVVRDGHVAQYVNGKLANEGTDPSPKEGKILLQSEGAEVYFRNVKVWPIGHQPAAPAEQAPGVPAAHPEGRESRPR